jgi:hypothetical protein
VRFRLECALRSSYCMRSWIMMVTMATVTAIASARDCRMTRHNAPTTQRRRGLFRVLDESDLVGDLSPSCHHREGLETNPRASLNQWMRACTAVTALFHPHRPRLRAFATP